MQICAGCTSRAVSEFERGDGSVIATVPELTGRLEGLDWAAKIATGRWDFDEPAYIDLEGTLVGIDHLDYRVPYLLVERERLREPRAGGGGRCDSTSWQPTEQP